MSTTNKTTAKEKRAKKYTVVTWLFLSVIIGFVMFFNHPSTSLIATGVTSLFGGFFLAFPITTIGCYLFSRKE